MKEKVQNDESQSVGDGDDGRSGKHSRTRM